MADYSFTIVAARIGPKVINDARSKIDPLRFDR